MAFLILITPPITTALKKGTKEWKGKNKGKVTEIFLSISNT